MIMYAHQLPPVPENPQVRAFLRVLDMEISAWWTAQILEFQASGRALPPGLEW